MEMCVMVGWRIGFGVLVVWRRWGYGWYGGGFGAGGGFGRYVSVSVLN